MIKSKEEITSVIRRICKQDVKNRKLLQKRMMQLKSKYNIPISISQSILTLENNMESENDFVIFCVLDVVNNGLVKGFFTDSEIKEYRAGQYKTNEIKCPLRFKMVQVTSNQWIGSVTVKELMMLRDAQMINYNENTQRAMQRVIDGNVEYYKIALNKKAVDGIKESMLSETYIPNTITLNMPMDYIDYSYSDGTLTFKKPLTFDILDGYHRYIAMSKIYSLDPKFDYNMELRIVQFETDTAKQFIWQEDQKTKMKKADSASFNQEDSANKIVERLNREGMGFPLHGKINRNRCVINAPELAALIKMLWFSAKGDSRETTLKKEREILDKLRTGIETVVFEKLELADKRWDFKYLACIVVCIHADVERESLVATAERLYAEFDENITVSRVNKHMLKRMAKLI